MHWEVLDQKRKKILMRLGFLKKHGFYMAGGTALALQIAHRTSLDFDFYTKKEFDARKLREEFDEKFRKVQEIYIAQDTLGLDAGGIKMSFFRYPYGLIRPCVQTENICLASKQDIAAMKILAISQRGKRRDFIDIYFLLKEFGLREIMEFTKEKYPMFNIYVGLQGLIYFEDAEDDPEKHRFKMLRKINWREIKKYIIKEANIFKKLL